MTMDGIDFSVTGHSKGTCTSCVARSTSSPDGGVTRGCGFTTKPFVTLEGNIGKFLRSPGAKPAPKVVEIPQRSLGSDLTWNVPNRQESLDYCWKLLHVINGEIKGVHKHTLMSLMAKCAKYAFGPENRLYVIGWRDEISRQIVWVATNPLY